MERDPGFMDWVDRVRAQAADMATRAQDAERMSEEAWGESGRFRRDDLLRLLGSAVYDMRVHGVNSDREQRIRLLLAELVALDTERGVIDLREPIDIPNDEADAKAN